jgi:hypothetical protein
MHVTCPTHLILLDLIPFRFSTQNIVYICHLFHACYMPHPSHPPWFYRPNNIW